MRYLVGLLLCVNGVRAASPPLKLSETGLYADFSKKIVSLENRVYSPQYPLWTDGALKRRWVFIPHGTQIAVDLPDQWVFPVGTRFWKEFSFVAKGENRRVETRYMEKVTSDEWVFASYLWNKDEGEGEALLAPEDGVKDYYPISSSLNHSIPSTTQCLRCHRKQGDGVLGFDALQLSGDRDPSALHGESLEPGSVLLKTLIDEKKFNQVPAEFKDGNIRIPSSSTVGRTVMGYFHSNCASCHNAFGSSMHVRMDLSFNLSAQTEEELFAYKSSVEKKCVVFQFPSEPKGVRVVKGAPEKSVLFRMMEGHGTEHMPPIGTVLQDVEAIGKIRKWILGL